jgi:glycosyltransferase involved in cell wall biosynthesis
MIKKNSHYTKEPYISVIVPIYNVEKYLPKCLESLAQQTLRPEDFEIILINDASPDNSYTIAKEFAKEHENVKVLNNAKNLGLGRTRNKGIKEAKGEYLFFLDSDDSLDITALETMLIKALEEEADIVTTGYTRVNEKGEILAINNAYYSLGSNRIDILERLLAHKIPSMSCARLIKKELFIDNNIWFPEGLHEDVAVVYKLFMFAKKTCGIKHSFYYWLTHQDSITSYVGKKHVDSLIRALQEKSNYILKTGGKDLHSRLDPAIKEGWCFVFQSKLKQIVEYEKKNESNEVEIYKYIFNSLKDNKDFRNALELYRRKYLFLYIFFESFESLPPERALENFYYYINDKRRLLLYTSKSKLKYIVYFSKKYLNPLYKFYKLFKDICTYDGNILDKINYSIRRLFKTISKITKKLHLKIKNFLNKLKPKIKADMVFFCDNKDDVRTSVEIIEKLPREKVVIALTKDLYDIEIKRKIKKYKYEKKTFTKLDLQKLQMAIYFSDKRDSYVNDIREFRRQNIKTVGILSDEQDFYKEKGFYNNLYPFRVFEYLILTNPSYEKFFRDKKKIIVDMNNEDYYKTYPQNLSIAIEKILKEQ